MSTSQWTARPRPMSAVQTRALDEMCDRCRRAMYAVPVEGPERCVSVEGGQLLVFGYGRHDQVGGVGPKGRATR